MTLPAIITNEYFELGLTQSSSHVSGQSRQLVDLNGSYRTRKLDMKGMGGGNSKVNDLGLMTLIGGSRKVLILAGELVEHVDLREREQQLKIDMLRAFKSDIVHMQDFVQEVMTSLAAGSHLTQEQQDKLFELVSEIVTIKNLTNLDALPQSAELIRDRIAEVMERTVEMLESAFDGKDLPPEIVKFAHEFLSDVSAHYGLEGPANVLMKMDVKSYPQEYMQNTLADVIAELNTLLEKDDLDPAAKAEITEMVEQLEMAQEQGVPISTELARQLQAFSESHPEMIVDTRLEGVIETLVAANISLKADLSGLSVAQIKEIEAHIDELMKEEGQSQDKETVTALEALMRGDKLNERDIETVYHFIEPKAFDQRQGYNWQPIATLVSSLIPANNPGAPVRGLADPVPTPPKDPPAEPPRDNPKPPEEPPVEPPRDEPKPPEEPPVEPPRDEPKPPEEPPVEPPRDDPKPPEEPPVEPPRDEPKPPEEPPVEPPRDEPKPPEEPPAEPPRDDPKPSPEDGDCGCGECKGEFNENAGEGDEPAVDPQVLDEIAKKFGGDKEAAREEIERMKKLDEEIETAKKEGENNPQRKKDQAERDAARERRRQERENARQNPPGENTNPKPEFNKKGCPVHGLNCKGHGSDQTGVKASATSNKRSARARKLEM